MPELGWLASKYEVGRLSGPATVSSGLLASGQPDKGGKSYGSFQLASNRGIGDSSVRAFVEAYYLREFEAPENEGGRSKLLTPGTEEFNRKWKEVVAMEGERYTNNDREFIHDTHFKPIVEFVKQTRGVDLEAHGRVLQEVVWSTSVQHGSQLDVKHGHGHKLIRTAIDNIRSQGAQTSSASFPTETLIAAIYRERERRHPNDAIRYKREERNALDALTREQQETRRSAGLNESQFGRAGLRIGILAAPDRLPPKELQVRRGQQTFDFSGHDLQFETTRKPHVSGDYSGIRIGRGYDLAKESKEQAEQDLLYAGLTALQVKVYSNAAGLRGTAAREYLDSFTYSRLSTEASQAGLSREEVGQYVSEHSPREISLEQQKRLFERTYRSAESEAARVLPGFDQFPQPARDAIVDLVFDRGLVELGVLQPGILQALEQQDWETAAELSKRNGAGFERNQATKDLFDTAAEMQGE